MIKLNNIVYENYETKISLGSYEAKIDGRKKKGKAPFITFHTDKFIIGIEMVYDIEWIRKLKNNDQKDISKYISDITYEDEQGWISLIEDNHKCLIERLDNNNYNLKFSNISKYENISIEFDTKIIF